MISKEALVAQWKATQETNSSAKMFTCWGSIAGHEELFRNQDPLEKPYLKVAEVSRIGTSLFSDNRAFAETATALGIDPSAVTEIRGGLYQFGRKALILQYTAVTQTDNYPFVCYLARDHKDSQLGQEAYEDYQNLSWLFEQFQRKVPANVREQYDVVKPFVYNQTEYKNKKYPFFTMPYVPYSEITLLAVQANDTFTRSTVSFPFFVPQFDRLNPLYGESIKRNHSEAYHQAVDFQQGSESLFHEFLKKAHVSHGAFKQSDDALQPNTITPIFRKQRDDILRGNILIYLVSEGKFPKEFQINAGDWMGTVNNDDTLTLRLTSVRGGFEIMGGLDAFYQRMHTHAESHQNVEILIRPFASVTREEFYKRVDEVRGLLVA